MTKFTLVSSYSPNDEQANACEQIVSKFAKNQNHLTLLGVTGSGKTFTMAQVIEKTQKPTLILCHNKTLAGQLYQEFREFFPHNAVSYFVSYYDYYQPEAYMPSSDTFIEKEAQINEMIDRLRLATMSNLVSRSDCIVIASVSCIYGLGNPEEFLQFVINFQVGEIYPQAKLIARLTQLQYERSEFDFKRGTFRIRGDNLDVYPAFEEFGYRLAFEGERLVSITRFDPLTGKNSEQFQTYQLFPTKQYLVSEEVFASAKTQIAADLQKEAKELKDQGKIVEAARLTQRVSYDLEMLTEFGYVNGVENYSRYFDGRPIGAPPFTLLSYFSKRFGDDWQIFIDESHMTIPQVRGMYGGDKSRKDTLIEYGFRLKSASDNRPLKFEEFESNLSKVLYVSATPGPYEEEKSGKNIIQQLVRPTGIADPQVSVRPIEGAIADLIVEIDSRIAKKERVLVTTLTKRTAEDLSKYLEEKKYKSCYLHSDVQTLERSDILSKLRKGEYDVLIGINLLREGIDLPEVSLVAILDADKEGFLRGRTSLIQTMGRAARHLQGQVIMYADKVSNAMSMALEEVGRRRSYQLEYNKKHNITPFTIQKTIRENIIDAPKSEVDEFISPSKNKDLSKLITINAHEVTHLEKTRLIKKLEKEMHARANDMDFETAIALRDKIKELKS